MEGCVTGLVLSHQFSDVEGGELAGWKNPHHLTLTQKILVQTKSFRKLGKGGRERDREREREKEGGRERDRERERERARGCLPTT